jgi:uncharacterized LabA/DUF88 family protein
MAEKVEQNILQGIRGRERVCIFIDNSNLFHALRATNNKMDYKSLRRLLADGRGSDVRFYYSINEKEEFDETDLRKVGREKFYNFLDRVAGFSMIRLPLRERTNADPVLMALVNRLLDDGYSESEILATAKQTVSWLRQARGEETVISEKGMDCEIVYDMVRLCGVHYYDSFILVTGDEDFARTVRKLRMDYGIRVEVAFFQNRCSNALMREASRFIDLAAMPELFVAPKEMP